MVPCKKGGGIVREGEMSGWNMSGGMSWGVYESRPRQVDRESAAAPDRHIKHSSLAIVPQRKLLSLFDVS